MTGCMKPERQDNPDPVARSIHVANGLLDQLVPDRQMVSRLIEVLESFQPRELVRFDDQARSCHSGIRWSKVPRLRGGGEPDGERPSMRDRLLHRGEPGRRHPTRAGSFGMRWRSSRGTAISESMRFASRGFGHSSSGFLSCAASTGSRRYEQPPWTASTSARCDCWWMRCRLPSS